MENFVGGDLPGRNDTITESTTTGTETDSTATSLYEPTPFCREPTADELIYAHEMDVM